MKEDYTYTYESKKASTFFPTEPTRHVTTKNRRPYRVYDVPIKDGPKIWTSHVKMGANNGISARAAF